MTKELVAHNMVKICRAIERGTLPLDLEVRNHGGIGIDLYLGARWSSATDYHLERQQQVLAWLTKTYPDGVTMQQVQSTYSTQAYRQRKRWHDVRHWVSNNDGETPLVAFDFSVPHICRMWSAHVPPHQLPTWTCDRCHKPLSKTAARAMGLIP